MLTPTLEPWRGGLTTSGGAMRGAASDSPAPIT